MFNIVQKLITHVWLYFHSLCVILFSSTAPNLQHSLPSMAKDNTWRTKRIRFVYVNPAVQQAFESAIKMNEKSRNICKNKIRSKKVCSDLPYWPHKRQDVIIRVYIYRQEASMELQHITACNNCQANITFKQTLQYCIIGGC